MLFGKGKMGRERLPIRCTLVGCKPNMKKAKIVFLAVVMAIVYLSLPISYAQLTPELVMYLVYVGFAAIGLGIVTFYIGEGNILLSASLLVFALEFLVFVWSATFVNQDIEHITVVLQGNPTSISNAYVQELVSDAAWYGIFPTALGIGLYVASFVARRKALTGWLRNVLLLIAGGFILFLGTCFPIHARVCQRCRRRLHSTFPTYDLFTSGMAQHSLDSRWNTAHNYFCSILRKTCSPRPPFKQLAHKCGKSSAYTRLTRAQQKTNWRFKNE